MALAGWKVRVEITDNPLALADEACSVLVGNTYQITAASKRIMDPRQAVVVKSNAVVVSAALYTIDYLFGRIIFAAPPTAPVTVSGFYLPRVQVGCAKEFSLEIARDGIDATCFQPDAVVGHRRYIQGLKTASGSFGYLGQLDETYFGATETLVEYVLRNSEQEFFVLTLEFSPTNIWRGFVIVESHDMDADVSDLVNANVNWVLAPPGYWSEVNL